MSTMIEDVLRSVSTLKIYGGSRPMDADASAAGCILLAELSVAIDPPDMRCAPAQAFVSGRATFARLADSGGGCVADLSVGAPGTQGEVHLPGGLDIVAGELVRTADLRLAELRS